MLNMSAIYIFLVTASIFISVNSQREWCSNDATFKEPSFGTCKGYWECNKGNVTFNLCSTLHSYDPLQDKCVFSPVRNNNNCNKLKGRNPDKDWCTQGKTYKAAVNGECNSYYACNNGTISLEKCTWPLQFNPYERSCQLHVWPVLFECYKPADNSPQVTTQPTTTEKPRCPVGSNFLSPNPNDCTKYYKCTNGTETIEQCGFLQNFDSITNECRYKTLWSDIKCATNETKNNGVTTKATTKPEVSTTKLPASKPSLICLKGNYYKSVDSEDCQKYYLCSNGTVKLQSCSLSYRFNPLSHECTVNIPYIDEVNCSAQSDKPICKVGYSYRTHYPGNAKKYYNCNNGTLTTVGCGYLHVYDNKTQNCIVNVFGLALYKKEESLQNKICMVGSYFNETYDDDCHKYKKCYNGTITIEECNYGYKFDGQQNKCTTMTQCDLLTCYSKGPVCYPGLHYLTSVPNHCDKYHECNNGQWSTKSCSWLHYFDPTTLECKLRLFNKIDCNAKVKCSNCSIIDLVNENKQLSVNIENVFYFINKDKPKCQNNEKYVTVYPNDCSKFYQCKDGKLTIESCGVLDMFDPKKLECRMNTLWNPVDCKLLPGQPSCLKGEKFQTVYPGYCSKYYVCNDGEISVESCYFWQKFNPKTLQCKINIPYILPVNCTEKPMANIRSITVKPTTSTSANSVATLATTKQPEFPTNLKTKCKNGVNFKEVDEKDCDKYYSCSNGTFSHEKCGVMMKFNPKSLSCSMDLPFHRVNCTALPGEPECPQKGVTRVPYPNDCKKYYECNNGVFTVKNCGLLESFDHDQHVCRSTILHNVKCNS